MQQTSPYPSQPPACLTSFRCKGRTHYGSQKDSLTALSFQSTLFRSPHRSKSHLLQISLLSLSASSLSPQAQARLRIRQNAGYTLRLFSPADIPKIQDFSVKPSKCILSSSLRFSLCYRIVAQKQECCQEVRRNSQPRSMRHPSLSA